MFLLINKIKANILNNSAKKLYTIGMFLALGSAIFGILREVLIIKVLGFSTINDYLQIYLSLYFAICAFSEPVRLIYLNLIEERYFYQLVLFLLSIVILLSTVLVFFMWKMELKLQFFLLLIAAIDGVLGVWVSLTIFHKQRFGAYLNSQLINVLPNFVLVPMVILLGFFPKNIYTINLLIAFFCLHIGQLTLLAFIKTKNPEKNKYNIKWGDIYVSIRHFISILGEQFFQIIARLLFLRLGAGYVTLLSLFFKFLYTSRFVFIDSFIGPALHKWAFSEKNDVIYNLLRNNIINIFLFALVFFVCLLKKESLIITSVQLIFIFIAAFYFSSLYRIAYFKINRFIHYAALVTFVGGFDLAFSGLIYTSSHLWYPPIYLTIFYIFSWYIVRLPIEMLVLTYYYKRIRMHYL
ncbi:MAG: hypothetical protein K2Q14_01265 [Gammaproteobacteria bacterium]|nr:hypothetical protein [Gammaproteobacteria bacterium]